MKLSLKPALPFKIPSISISSIPKLKPNFKNNCHCCSTIAQPVKFNSITSQDFTRSNDLFAPVENEDTMLPFSAAAGRRGEEKFANRWMEYQGIRNWEGLLDPLDDNLRGEILRYGDFVEATYKSFDFDPSSETYATCRFPKNTLLEKSGLPDTGYRLTRHLRATSGIQLPRWIEKAPSWVATQSSWIGYVAVCQDKEEIARLGRRDVVIAYRGTATCLEWLENLRATLTQITDSKSNIGKWPIQNGNSECQSTPPYKEKNIAAFSEQAADPIQKELQRLGVRHVPESASLYGQPMVESGFLSLYTSKKNSCSSLQEMIREEIKKILKLYPDEPLSLTITGHSLGAALATLTAYDIKKTFKHAPLVTVISFGGPRVGNRSFRQHLEKQGTKVLRIVNSDDLITKVPGFVIDDEEKDELNGAEGLPSWIQKRVEDTQWVYSEVGRELRLSSKDSPYVNSVNVAACHELKTYLHLVDGFVSKSCPFRATAKRVLSKYNME